MERIPTWLRKSADRYWTIDGGPLAHPSNGGADFIIVDDPQMCSLVPLCKEKAPERPVVFRSHIDIVRKRVAEKGSNVEFVWKSLWEYIKVTDVYIGHPMREMIPEDVPERMLGYMPATTDW